MTKGDMYARRIINRILKSGSMDITPRAHYADGTPAHAKGIDHVFCTYDLSKGESPIITLRPTAYKNGIGEILWIYRDQSNDLEVLKDKYGITWWDDWDIGNRTIGKRYGGTVSAHDLMTDYHEGMANEPDSRRHKINLWQVDDFKETPGLNPCAYDTTWNVRHEADGDYLDLLLSQRSSDYCVASCINQMQYVFFLYAMAKKYNYKLGRFSWVCANVHIYDRHFENAEEMISRESVDCNPYYVIDEDCTWENMMPDNVHLEDYPREEIKKKNKQLKFELAI